MSKFAFALALTVPCILAMTTLSCSEPGPTQQEGRTNSKLGADKTDVKGQYQRCYRYGFVGCDYCPYDAPSDSIFEVDGGIWWANNTGQTCYYQDPSYVRELGGGKPIIHLDAFPQDAERGGACQPSTYIFSVNGGVYYENESSQVCVFQDESYLSGLASGAVVIYLDSFPVGASFGGACQPTNLYFEVGGTVYFENADFQYCSLQDASNVAPTHFNSLPSGANYVGQCQ